MYRKVSVFVDLSVSYYALLIIEKKSEWCARKVMNWRRSFNLVNTVPWNLHSTFCSSVREDGEIKIGQLNGQPTNSLVVFASSLTKTD